MGWGDVFGRTFHIRQKTNITDFHLKMKKNLLTCLFVCQRCCACARACVRVYKEAWRTESIKRVCWVIIVSVRALPNRSTNSNSISLLLHIRCLKKPGQLITHTTKIAALQMLLL